MSRKPDGTQRSGRGTAPPAAGGFGGADTALTRLARPFVPKPFRSTGGMSTSADTMMSIGMGRHNNDDEMPEDQVNIASIVDRKVSDRRYLPRKLGNMKYYLHTTPINELLNLDENVLHRQVLLYESDLNELFDNLTQTDVANFFKKGADVVSSVGKTIEDTADSLDPALRFAAAFVPFGDLYYGYRAFKEFGTIKDQVDKIHEVLRKSGTDIDLSDPPSENKEKIKNLNIPSAADRALLKDASIKISIACYTFLIDIVTAIPFEIIPGMSVLDTGLDVALDSIIAGQAAFDPDDEKLGNALLTFSENYLDDLSKFEDRFVELGKQSGIGEDALKKIKSVSSFIGNLALLHNEISENLSQIEASDDPDILAERTRIKKKKKKKTDEISGVGSIAGYTGPMAGPGNPKKFYPSMARAAGGEYLIDPVKNLKAKP